MGKQMNMGKRKDKPSESDTWPDALKAGLPSDMEGRNVSKLRNSGKTSELPPGWNPRMQFATANFEDGAVDASRLEDRPAGDGAKSEAAGIRPADSLALRIFERPMDIIVSSILMLLFLPLMIVIGVIIRLDSPGPALFFQTRLGRDRRRRSNRGEVPSKGAGLVERRARELASRPFQFVKFRTMHVDARARFPELYEYQYSEREIRTMKFKLDDDPRLTRVGVWLRKSSLDELPNLWSVFAGRITLVGPRPEIPEMSPYYTAAQRRKFQVTPGVTGLAQVCGRGRLSFQETVAYDLEYVEKRSLRLNLSILWRTFIAVIRCRGAF